MVGLPRYESCQSCKRKKKGCDRRRPICSRCRRYQVDCVYQCRPIAFVNGLQPLTTTAASRSLEAAAWDIQTDNAFWLCWRPKTNSRPSPRTTSVNFTKHVASLQTCSTRDTALRAALRACAYSCLGALRDDTSFRRRTLQLYSTAIQELKHALRDPVRMRSDAVVAACRFVTVCELLRSDSGVTSSQALDWQQHIEGAYQIIRLRSLEQNTRGLGLSLLAMLRYLGLRIAITQRKPELLLTHMWSASKPPSLEDELFDIIASIPSRLSSQTYALQLLAETGSHSKDSTVLTTLRTLLNDFSVVATAFDTWEHRALAVSCQLSHQDRALEGATLLSVGPLCGIVMMLTLNRYWLACLFFYSEMHEMAKALSGIYPDDPIILPPSTDPRRFASSIVQMAPNIFRLESGLWAVEQAAEGLGYAIKYFASHGAPGNPEVALIQSLQSSNRYVKLIDRFLYSISV